MPRFCLDLMGSPPPQKKRFSWKNATVLSGLWCDLQNKKKRSSVFQILISQCHFDGPSEVQEPSAGSLEANWPHDGPPKIHGPRGHCPTLPPSRRLCRQTMSSRPKECGDPNLVLRRSGCGPWSAFIDPKVRMWAAVLQLSSNASTVYDYSMILILCSKFWQELISR